MLLAFEREAGHAGGMVSAMPDGMQVDAILSMMVAEAIKTSEIEGEYFSRQDVVSSIRNNMGLNVKREAVKDKKAKGAGELMVAVRNSYSDQLSREMLFEWHRTLLPQPTKILVGAWRRHKEPMQVISGTLGKETIHFEAPPSARVASEMKAFIQWFNDTAPGGKREIKIAAVRSALAHLYFETIHPFQDGNGRIGRAIAEKALAQTMGHPVMLSLSQAIEAERKAYCAALEAAQRSNEVTKWLTYFIHTLIQAQLQAKVMLVFTLKKANFFNRFSELLNERQLKAINKMLDAGPKGFEGGMTAAKYISITSASKATSTRDLQDLSESGVLLAEGAGRSTRYILNW